MSKELVKMLKFLFILLTISYQTKANDFIVVANEQSFFQACDPSDNHGNTILANLAEINIHNEYAEDMETLVSNGNISVKVDIPENIPIKMKLDVFQWKRGKWEHTIFSIRRLNFCKVVFDPSEPWYGLTMQVPEKYRDCPPKRNTVYQVENMKNVIKLSNIFAVDLEGQYKIIIHFIVSKYATCFTTKVNIWKD